MMGRTVIDETGNKYGRLFVIERAESHNNHAAWKCLCDCGKVIVTLGRRLRGKNTQSCGCLRDELSSERNSLPSGEAAFNRLFSNYWRSAKDREITWELTKDRFRELTQRDCHFCCNEPERSTWFVALNSQYRYNGIDRVDNNQGYTLGNSVACCWICNRAKGELSENEFLKWARRVCNYSGV